MPKLSNEYRRAYSVSEVPNNAFERTVNQRANVSGSRSAAQRER
jgi:hypothetical protein